MPIKKKRKQLSGESVNIKGSSKLYTLAVYIIGGPISDEFEGQTVSRTIQIRGDQTLEDLHKAIFKAFNRFDPHLYEFNLGAGPDDRTAIYSIPFDVKMPGLDEEMAGDVRTTTIDSLGLEVGRAFGYLFDFGDDWQHQINVEAIEESPIKGKYPKIIKREGKSPPQYPDPDEE
ncbi:MAG: plasmid pRiA4b ORF-3 family protein [Methanotrichaceae archaeon]